MVVNIDAIVDSAVKLSRVSNKSDKHILLSRPHTFVPSVPECFAHALRYVLNTSQIPLKACVSAECPGLSGSACSSLSQRGPPPFSSKRTCSHCLSDYQLRMWLWHTEVWQ